MMVWWLAVVATILALVLLRGRVYVHLRYRRVEKEDCFVLELRLFDRVRLYRRTVQHAIGQAAGKLLAGRRVEKARQSRGTAKKPDRSGRWRAFGRVLAESVCTKLEARVRVATPDAALTALLFGAAHAAEYWALRSAARRVRFAVAPDVAISADFAQKETQIELHCIFAARLGNLIGIFISTSKA